MNHNYLTKSMDTWRFIFLIFIRETAYLIIGGVFETKLFWRFFSFLHMPSLHMLAIDRLFYSVMGAAPYQGLKKLPWLTSVASQYAPLKYFLLRLIGLVNISTWGLGETYKCFYIVPIEYTEVFMVLVNWTFVFISR